jgi:hypothetical protein
MSFIDPYNIFTSAQTQISEQNNKLLNNDYGSMRTNYNPSTGTYGGYAAPAGSAVTGTVADVNAQNRANQTLANQARIPGAAGLEAKSSANIADQLMGKIPEDVLAMLGQGAGERSVGTGMIGAPASEAAYRRALGLTSIGQQEAGQKNLSAAYARNPGAPLYNAGEFAITPLQQAQLDLTRRGQDLSFAARNSGGGGGGGSTRVTGDGSGGQKDTLTGADLFGPGYGRYGNVYSGSNEWSPYSPAPYSEGSSPALEGFYPTSSGEMFMGDPADYEASQYFNGGWLDEAAPY